MSDSEINELHNCCDYSSMQDYGTMPSVINMQPLQVGHKIEDRFLEL